MPRRESCELTDEGLHECRASLHLLLDEIGRSCRRGYQLTGNDPCGPGLSSCSRELADEKSHERRELRFRIALTRNDSRNHLSAHEAITRLHEHCRIQCVHATEVVDDRRRVCAGALADLLSGRRVEAFLGEHLSRNLEQMLTRAAPLFIRGGPRRCNISVPHTSIIQGRSPLAFRLATIRVYTPVADHIQI